MTGYALRNLYAEGVLAPADPDKSAMWLERVAEMGSGVAASQLLLDLEGGGTRVPAERVIALLTRAALAGDPSAQAGLGRVFHEGVLVARDPGAALRWFLAAAQAGQSFAQAWMGDMLLMGQDVIADRDEAVRWYREAAAQGHVGALQALSNPGLRSDDPREAQALFRLWLAAAENGDLLARRVVGEHLVRGLGVEASVPEGVRWLRLAREGGSTAAGLVLAAVLLQGQAEPAYPTEPIDLLAAAAAEGNVDAQYNLGVCHRLGLCVPVDLGAARGWYERAARAGQPSAQLALGDLLTETATDAAGIAEAIEWYRAAAAASALTDAAAAGIARAEARLRPRAPATP